jgi:hypothetical protein
MNMLHRLGAKEVGARAKKIVDVKIEGPITLTPEQLAIVAAGFVAAASGGHGATTGMVGPVAPPTK